MRWSLGPIFLAGVLSVFAQSTGDSALAHAQAEVERIVSLVKLGAAPPVQLKKAQDALADAEDEAILSRTLYGDLTEDQAADMLAAAARRLDRQRQALTAAEKLVNAGAAAPATLEPARRQVQAAEKEKGMAQSRADLVHEIADMALVEADDESWRGRGMLAASGIADHFEGSGVFTTADLSDIVNAFDRQFHKPLPISAQGETATHRAMGFDHTGRVDVALQPDSPEGQWLRAFLMLKKVPFFSFRQAVPGKATGAHIHVGPLSTRIAGSD